MKLQDSSIVVILALSQWTARKLDRKITDEVNEQHNASSDAGRYNKLLVDKTYLDPIVKIANRARTFHYENTLCWGDNGDRLLPAENYFPYVTAMGKMKREFESAVEAFLKNYNKVMANAKERLNGMFNEKDYPSKLEIESKFGFKTDFMPVPDTDFRVKLNKAEVDKLKKELEGEMTNRLTAAVGNIWERIHDQLSKMKAKLSDKDSIFRDSLFGNLQELIELLPKLNITKDVNIAKICNEMKALVVSPDEVRNNDSVRSKKAKEVNDVLKKFGAFFNK